MQSEGETEWGKVKRGDAFLGSSIPLVIHVKVIHLESESSFIIFPHVCRMLGGELLRVNQVLPYCLLKF